MLGQTLSLPFPSDLPAPFLPIQLRNGFEYQSKTRRTFQNKTQSCICADPPLAVHNLVDPHGWNAYVFGQAILADAHWLQELFKKYFAWMNRRIVSHNYTSMIINNLNFVYAVISPFKTDSPLIIDANAVLPFACPLQRFKPIRGRDT